MKPGATMKAAFLIFTLALCSTELLRSQQKQKSIPKPEVSCEGASKALESGAYVFGALNHVWPSSFGTSQGITIAVELRPGVKLLLHTMGGKSQLWADTLGIPGSNVWQFLQRKAELCELPADPADAVKLMKVSWEDRELSQSQFDLLHRDFMKASAEYVSRVGERSSYFMATNLGAVYLDASYYPIVYDNTYEHFEIKAWNVPIDHQKDPVVEWVHELQNFAEERFHRPIGREQ
jgi:hypothetical protein